MHARLAVVLWLVACFPVAAADDLRNVRHGLPIASEGYCDQPYVVVTRDGHWLCTLTTGRGHEGQRGQHIVSTTSTDRGRTWSPLVDIEPVDGPAASWVTPLATPGGRVYAFYTYNGEQVETLRDKRIRSDTHGWYCYRYSDDNGRTWSDRHRIPLRPTACDRQNDWQGAVQMFWGIDKPKVVGQDVYFAFTKLGKFFLEQGEGWLVHSSNLLSERNSSKLQFEILPDGEHGIRSPRFGSVQEEHNLVPLGDGSLYCVYRTTRGFPAHTYSRDGGRTWEPPVPMTYAPLGPTMKNPRACPKLFRTAAGRDLFWYHNHGGKAFEGRNPVWLSGGVERGGRIHWSQPEIVLYDPDPKTRMSYPDLIEQDGRFWLTETQKTVARVHEVDPALLQGLWQQGQRKEVAGGIAWQQPPAADQKQQTLDLSKTDGLTIDAWIELKDLSPGQTIVDNRDAKGRGVWLRTAEEGALSIELGDGASRAVWQSDRGALRAGKPQHVAAVVDAGPQIILFLVDGVLLDGGAQREQGWTRYEKPLGDVAGLGQWRAAEGLAGALHQARVYHRALRVSEVVANFHAGLPVAPDVVFYNGTIATVDADFSVASAMAVRGERIVAVGSDEAMLARAGPETKRVDLARRFVMPGLIDSHSHPPGASMFEFDHEVPTMESIDDVLAYVKARAEFLGEGKWIRLQQVFITRLRERRFPTRAELDRAAPNNPVIFRTGPDAALNSRALALGGIDKDYVVPDGVQAKVERDADGEPTGVLRSASRLINVPSSERSPTADDRYARLKLLMQAYNAAGITSVTDRSVSDDSLRLYERLRDDGALTCRMFLTYYVDGAGPWERIEAGVRRAVEHPAHRYDNRLWLRGLKVFLDGGMLTGSALMREPWGVSALYGISDLQYRGMRYIDEDKLYRIARLSLQSGLQLTAHAVGDGAVQGMVDAYQRLDGEWPVHESRPCICHANFMTAEIIERMRSLGVVADLQPAWLHMDGATLRGHFGPQRLRYFQPYKTLFDRGVVVGGGSDHMQKLGDMRSINPYSPFYGIWITLSRQPRWSDEPLHAEEIISRRQALELYTIHNAWLTFEEREKGSLEAGKLADFVVLDRNLLECPVDAVRETAVLETWLGGRRVH